MQRQQQQQQQQVQQNQTHLFEHGILTTQIFFQICRFPIDSHQTIVIYICLRNVQKTASAESIIACLLCFELLISCKKPLKC